MLLSEHLDIYVNIPHQFSNCKAVQEVVLTAGVEPPKPKVTLLAVMCQHTAGLKYRLALSLPAVAGYSSNFSFHRTPFPFSSPPYKPSGRDSVKPKENQPAVIVTGQ